MQFLEKVKNVLMTPSDFFKEVVKETGITEAFKYLLVIGLISLAINFVVSSIIGIALSALNPIFAMFGVVTYFLLIGAFIVIIFAPFIGAAILHLFIKLFGGTSDYSATYKTVVYSSTPSMLFGWIPFINYVMYIYNFYLLWRGTSIMHKMSMGRAFLALLILIIIPVLLIAIAFLYAIGLFSMSSGLS